MANGKSLNSLEGNVCSIRDKCKYIYSELYSIFNLKPFRVNYSLNFKHLFSLLQQILMLPQLLLLTGIFCKKKNPNPCYHIKLPDEELSTSCQVRLHFFLSHQLLKELFEVCSISICFVPSYSMLVFAIYIDIWYLLCMGYPMLRALIMSQCEYTDGDSIFINRYG